MYNSDESVSQQNKTYDGGDENGAPDTLAEEKTVEKMAKNDDNDKNGSKKGKFSHFERSYLLKDMSV